jgi:hypothetical protein
MKAAWISSLAFCLATCGITDPPGSVTAAASPIAAARKELSVGDFRFDGPIGSAGARIAKLGANHFRMTLSHAPQHPDWANSCQFQITGNAKGNRLLLEVEFEHPKPQYRFDEYFHSWSYDGRNWRPIH